jgi:acetyl esterase/lipase
MKVILFLFIISIGLPVFSQKAEVRDTSYTVFSTYNKEIKKHPFIEIVKKQERQDINEIKDVVYVNTETKELHLDAFYKKEKGLNPAVILVHGGGWKSGDKSQMQIYAQEIASKGYSCFTIEYRLSPEAKYPAAIFDVKTAIKFIKTNAAIFNVDKTRIAVLGCSSGGQMAALIGTTNGNLEFENQRDGIGENAIVQAIIDIDGILAFKHPESEEGKVAALWLGGTYEEKPEIWNQASALSHVDKNTPPILFINSDMPRFHAGREDVINKLNKFGIYSKIKNIQNSPHSFWFFHPWFEEMMESTTDFLDEIFKNNNK